MPNPPPAPQLRAISEALSATVFTPDKYQSLFAPDVHVFENGTLVASSRVEWMERIRNRSAGPLVVTRNLTAIGPSEILVAETLSDFCQPSDKRVCDCCAWARIGRYTLGAYNLITDVRFFSDTLAYWEPPAPAGAH